MEGRKEGRKKLERMSSRGELFNKKVVGVFFFFFGGGEDRTSPVKL